MYNVQQPSMNGKVPAYNPDDLGSKPILNQRTFILDLGAVVVQKAQKATFNFAC